MRIRASVRKFSELMETKLKLNDHKGGWGGCDVRWLLKRLREETGEIETAMLKGDPKSVALECVDVANFAMMLSENFKAPERKEGEG